MAPTPTLFAVPPAQDVLQPAPPVLTGWLFPDILNPDYGSQLSLVAGVFLLVAIATLVGRLMMFDVTPVATRCCGVVLKELARERSAEGEATEPRPRFKLERCSKEVTARNFCADHGAEEAHVAPGAWILPPVSGEGTEEERANQLQAQTEHCARRAEHARSVTTKMQDRAYLLNDGSWFFHVAARAVPLQAWFQYCCGENCPEESGRGQLKGSPNRALCATCPRTFHRECVGIPTVAVFYSSGLLCCAECVRFGRQQWLQCTAAQILGVKLSVSERDELIDPDGELRRAVGLTANTQRGTGKRTTPEGSNSASSGEGASETQVPTPKKFARPREFEKCYTAGDFLLGWENDSRSVEQLTKLFAHVYPYLPTAPPPQPLAMNKAFRQPPTVANRVLRFLRAQKEYHKRDWSHDSEQQQTNHARCADALTIAEAHAEEIERDAPWAEVFAYLVLFKRACVDPDRKWDEGPDPVLRAKAASIVASGNFEQLIGPTGALTAPASLEAQNTMMPSQFADAFLQGLSSTPQPTPGDAQLSLDVFRPIGALSPVTGQTAQIVSPEGPSGADGQQKQQKEKCGYCRMKNHATKDCRKIKALEQKAKKFDQGRNRSRDARSKDKDSSASKPAATDG